MAAGEAYCIKVFHFLLCQFGGVRQFILSGLVIVKSARAIGLKIRLVILRVKRRLTAHRQGRRNGHARIFQLVIWVGEFLQSEACFFVRFAKFVV